MFLGDLELLAPAGAGGFSLVWKARRQGTGALLAVKVPRVEALLDHLRQEADLGQRLADPEIVPVLEVHLDADPPHLVMPWIEGQPIALPERAPAPTAQRAALLVALDLARILGRLHQAGVVHGDVKPGNVLRDGAGRLHLLDLGLAMVQVAAKLDRTLAQSVVSVDGKSIAGTLDFMAPELYENKTPGFAADVYSLGVLLHHLLTGRPPAFGVSPLALNPYLPPGLEDLLRRMLHHDPAQRIAQASLVVPELEALVAKEDRALARKNGHERRRVFMGRMATLERGLRALVTSAAVFVLIGGGIFAATRVKGGGYWPGEVIFVVGMASVAGVFLAFIPLLLAITTINAWLIGVPERTYKDRKGHPLWSFMMQ
jgi:serine/threonine protein kinase